MEAIDAFMTVFANVERSIDPAIKGSVVYSIASVVQTLPTERSIGPLVVRFARVRTRRPLAWYQNSHTFYRFNTIGITG